MLALLYILPGHRHNQLVTYIRFGRFVFLLFLWLTCKTLSNCNRKRRKREEPPRTEPKNGPTVRKASRCDKTLKSPMRGPSADDAMARACLPSNSARTILAPSGLTACVTPAAVLGTPNGAAQSNPSAAGDKPGSYAGKDQPDGPPAACG